jgi:hypothetical protein
MMHSGCTDNSTCDTIEANFHFEEYRDDTSTLCFLFRGKA